ncbi:MAG TPA: hypothetical protein VF572_00620 [Candidatus Saccharimonadales bacterium]|jgi:hypothetical protein
MKVRSRKVPEISFFMAVLAGCAVLLLSSVPAEAAAKGTVEYNATKKSKYAINVYSGKNCSGKRHIVKPGRSADGRSYRVNAPSEFWVVTAIVSSDTDPKLVLPNKCLTQTGHGGQYVMVHVFPKD